MSKFSRKGLPLVMVLAASGCSSATPQNWVDSQRDLRIAAVHNELSDLPDWFVEPPTEESALYSVGVGSSRDLALAMTKSIDEAKMHMVEAVRGTTSYDSRQVAKESGPGGNSFHSDYERSLFNRAAEVMLPGFTVAKREVQQDGDRIRVLVLLRFVPASDVGAVLADSGTYRELSAAIDAKNRTGVDAEPHRVVASPKGQIHAEVSTDEPPPPTVAPRVSVSHSGL